MKHPQHYYMFLCIILCTIPSCTRIFDWGKDSLFQGTTVEIPDETIKRNMRSIALYDQFSTCAIFDALYLSDEVRTAYVDVHAHKLGKVDAQKKLFLRRQLEENNYFISFYVLSLYEKPLGEPTSEWNVLLRIGDILYQPLEVKTVELSPEYEKLFGKLLTRFKVVYMVKFQATDIDGNYLITQDTRQIELHFRSVHKAAHVVWDFDQEGKAFITKIDKAGCYRVTQEGVYEHCDRC
jgi:hypothetical protein